MSDPLPFDPATITRADLEGVGAGLSSIVVRIRGTNIVVKTFPPLEKDQDSERRIYEHLQSHGEGHLNILKYLGSCPPQHELLRGGLLFEYHPRGTLLACFDRLDTLQIREEERRRWPYQVISAVAHIHSLDIVHGDIGLHNLLVHDGGRLILCDFAGSGLKGTPPSIAAGVRYSDPQRDHIPYPTVQDDIFALGTVLYELARGERLFDGQSSRSIYRHLRDRQFPGLSQIPPPLSDIIKKCWTCPDYTASDTLVVLGMLTPFHNPTLQLACELNTPNAGTMTLSSSER